jgi:phospholipid/cholesterol/gamma-HCH transport system substrate-binding protein
MQASYTRTEIGVGLFVILATAAIGYLSVSIAGLDLLPGDRMRLDARFATVAGLKQGAPVKMAGVSVGEVESIALDGYFAQVALGVRPDLALPKDTIASIKTEGLLGESYVSLSPGAADQDLVEGDRIAQTESPIDLIELIGKYAFGSSVEDEEAADDADSGMPDPFE